MAEADQEVAATTAAIAHAESLGVDISRIGGTGKDGAVTKKDVEAAVAARGAELAVAGLPSASIESPTEAEDALASREQARKALATAELRLKSLSPTAQKQIAANEKAAADADAAVSSAQAGYDDAAKRASDIVSKAADNLAKARAAQAEAHAKLEGSTADVTATVTRDASGLWAVHVQSTHQDETIISFNGRGVFKGTS